METIQDSTFMTQVKAEAPELQISIEVDDRTLATRLSMAEDDTINVDDTNSSMMMFEDSKMPKR
jgi:nicotinate-nucleotide pyrophosphorylase